MDWINLVQDMVLPRNIILNRSDSIKGGHVLELDTLVEIKSKNSMNLKVCEEAVLLKLHIF